MALIRIAPLCAGLILVCIGCRAPAAHPVAAIAPTTSTVTRLPASPKATAERQGSSASQAPVTVAQSAAAPAGHQVAFADPDVLSLDHLVADVLARNPSIEAMTAAWQAAAQRYPQVVALDDPTLMVMTAPGSWNSSQVDPAYTVGGAQKLPWPGKRGARGATASAEQNAAFQDVQDMRLQVVQSTQLAYFDYFLARRELELNERNTEAVRQFREAAGARYRANQVTQQDVLQADVELAEIARRQIELERMERVAVARINTLLRRLPQDPLPPPTHRLAVPADLSPADQFRQQALARRADLAALAARIRAEQARLELAEREFYPDVELYGRYDSFWQPASTQQDLRGQVGLNMNVPLYRNKRHAAVCEAMFRVNQRRAEYDQRVLDIQFDVQSAYEQVVESQRTVQLYEQQYLPAAEQNLATARTNYDVGRIDFPNLIVAQRQLIMLQERQQEALANQHRRLADLERVSGGRAVEVVVGNN